MEQRTNIMLLNDFEYDNEKRITYYQLMQTYEPLMVLSFFFLEFQESVVVAAFVNIECIIISTLLSEFKNLFYFLAFGLQAFHITYHVCISNVYSLISHLRYGIESKNFSQQLNWIRALKIRSKWKIDLFMARARKSLTMVSWFSSF